MPLVTWYKSYSVNNEELDNHHRHLFDILNRMYDSCLPAANLECAEKVIEELIEYADYHFAAEEKYMTEKGYKRIDEHRQEHRYFLDKLLGLRNCAHKDDYEYKKEIMAFIGNWILKHVTVEDKKFSKIP
ncbi:MAG TPA: bacteriohemerythrin [Geobacteraceae bacterium]|nr:bacteriohemerythrin [Geobacteraceae bacterium]